MSLDGAHAPRPSWHLPSSGYTVGLFMEATPTTRVTIAARCSVGLALLACSVMFPKCGLRPGVDDYVDSSGRIRFKIFVFRNTSPSV